MKIKFGSIVTQGRGKLGGHVYSVNRGGAYVRTNKTPTNPRTAAQQRSRAYLTTFSQQWSSLSEAQRDGWRNAVENFTRTDIFGDSKKLSGKNLFTSLNKELQLVTGQLIEEAPLPEDISVPTDVRYSSTVNDEGLSFDVSAAFNEDPDYLVIVATPPVSAGTNYVNNKLRVIRATPFSTFEVDPSIGSLYEAKYGIPPNGSTVFVGIYTVNAVGQRSPLIKVRGTIGDNG